MKIHITLLLLIVTSWNIISGQCNEETIWDKTWYSCEAADNPNPAREKSHWILYDLGAVYPLAESTLWNANQAEETDRGMKQVQIEVSMDQEKWIELGTFDFPQADGSQDYRGFEGPDFQGIRARYVLITALSNWGDPTCYGLSEVQFGIAADSLTTPVQSDLLKDPVIVYPNPAIDMVNISYTSERVDTWTITLYNLMGQEISRKDFILKTGHNRLHFPLETARMGTYWISISDEEGGTLFGQRLIVR